ncbi:MAG: DUF6152 family protein [Pseudomonadota bacterium]|nr:DUF6152 family protein [Pseudomonadota bacterium]
MNSKSWLFFLVPSFFSSPVLSHHGMGSFNASANLVLTGVVSDVALINPHAYVYLDAILDDNEDIEPWRCEMRAGTVLRRSGWSEELFLKGDAITIEGIPDRTEPNSCYVATVKFADGTSTDRYTQLSAKNTTMADGHAALTVDGRPNIFGDWAAEQRVNIDPRGIGTAGMGALLSDVRSGMAMGMGMGMGGALGLRPTAAMRAAVAGYVEARDNPRKNCRPTNIFDDWTFDQHINQITEEGDTIVMKYGMMDLTRTIHMNQAEHPDSVQSTWGHSIGRWEGEVLVVDTVGFEPGLLNFRVPIMYSEQLHVVERFSYDHERRTLSRAWVAEDPLYLQGTHVGQDEVQVSDLAYEPYDCDDRAKIENDPSFLDRLPSE